ncbi:MAG: ABC transporter permease [Hyphomonas sp.]|nr:ABC transporter permease [Hyphomonas sp.]
MARLARLRLNALVGGTLLLIALIAALVGQFAPPSDPIKPDFLVLLQPPSWEHPFGTDQFGRDMLSRVLAGAWVSLYAATLTVIVAFLLGTTLGALAGFYGGWIDRGVSVVTETLMAFPGLLLALAIMAVMGAGLVPLVTALGLAFAPSFVRVTRALVLSLKEKEFVEASRALGNSQTYTLFRHIVPNCVSSLSVLCTTILALALLAESALSFLGLGVQPPAPSWGGMLADGRGVMVQAPWMVIFPGVAIFGALLGINLLGDALRDWLDPRMEGEV